MGTVTNEEPIIFAYMNPIIDMIKELNLVDIKQREGVLHISYK